MVVMTLSRGLRDMMRIIELPGREQVDMETHLWDLGRDDMVKSSNLETLMK
jgi:hypothetical protein